MQDIHVSSGETSALHDQLIVLPMVQEIMEHEMCLCVPPTDHLSETEVVEHERVVPMLQGVPALGELFQLADLFVVLHGQEQGVVAGEEGGSMHIADVETGNLGANGIVAGGIPIATGAGLASKLQNKGTVAVSFFGDGALNEGAFHEAANMSAIWKLPVIFVCENNKYGMSNSTDKAFALEKLADRGLGYGIPGVTVDGNDVVAVYEAAERAVQTARDGGGPTLIECVTYRWKGHSRSDKNLYRTKEEIEEWKGKEPIAKFMSVLHEKNLLTQAEMDAIQQQATDEIIAAVNESVKAKAADPAGLEAAVFKAAL